MPTRKKMTKITRVRIKILRLLFPFMWLSGEVRDTYGEEKQKLIETMERGAGKDWRKSDYAVKQVNRAAVLCVINRLFWESVKDK